MGLYNGIQVERDESGSFWYIFLDPRSRESEVIGNEAFEDSLKYCGMGERN